MSYVDPLVMGIVDLRDKRLNDFIAHVVGIIFGFGLQIVKCINTLLQELPPMRFCLLRCFTHTTKIRSRVVEAS